MYHSSVVTLAHWRQRGSPHQPQNPAGCFWPDVYSRGFPGDAVAANSANSQQRVLFEIFLIFAVVGMIVAAVSVLIPPPL